MAGSLLAELVGAGVDEVPCVLALVPHAVKTVVNIKVAVNNKLSERAFGF
ncbi:hypothetical protein GCM10008018_25820 [Paenibacillus marchantiophytorum]|uniref:Uncharacterized protein n=1 Tax=Paenibacillus marchantiophytorum TaxID=1619310 RepID=A0ABQ1EMW9_9BACL|nr:hypothetical protein GCM10008018_25820 [Paenibacillus marchantiophytorum]